MNRKLNTEEIRRVSVDEYRRMAKIPLVLILDNVRSMHNMERFSVRQTLSV